ncbi:hypothetical protein EDC96DRAFT_511714 [Choanephora cucurbitarum]|nr:hypothetical protein EDC96DRAFT_511714 [Choanephora cucurbitarum]
MRLFSGPLDNTKWMPRAAMIKHHHVKVDIVSENGLVWIKVIARNAKAFRHEVMGFEWDSSSESEDEDDTRASANDFDNLPIFKKARDYLRTAKAHHVQFQTPIVVFAFMRIQPDIFVQKIMDRLTEMGIVVHLQPGELRASYLPYLHVDDIDHIATSSLNIDVSSALAILSELSHRVCPADQVSAMPLKIQAEREAKVPCLPQIVPYVSHRRLCMIQSAFERLQEIVEVVGGPNEKARFQYLFRHHFGLDLSFDPDLWTILPSLSIDIIPDASSEAFSKLLEPPADFRSKLNNGRKIRTRFSEFHAKIFGSGDHYQMTTLTAIQWMETALRDAGLQGQFLVSHEPRSLAERKMRVQA